MATKPCGALVDGHKRCKKAPIDGSAYCAKHTEEESKPLTDLQRRFVEEYLVDLNAAAAARRAGYAASGAKENACRLLQRPNVRAAVDRRLRMLAMGPGEVLARLTDHARGSIAPFLVEDDTRPGRVRIDLSTEDARKAFATLKKVKLKTTMVSEVARQETVEIELVDAQAALVHLGKAHGLFVDRHEVTGADGGALIPPRVLLPVDRLSDTALAELEAALLAEDDNGSSNGG